MCIYIQGVSLLIGVANNLRNVTCRTTHVKKKNESCLDRFNPSRDITILQVKENSLYIMLLRQ